MHVAIARLPAVPAERDKDFRDWFAWSNDQLRGMAGLRGRRLLRAQDGSYTSLVEYDSARALAAMHEAEAVSMIRRGLGRVLNDRQQTTRCDVLVEFATAEGCCREGHAACSCAGAAPEPGLLLVGGGEVPTPVSCAGHDAGRP